MVMSFFHKGSQSQSGMDHITAQVVTMLGEARRSFDLACAAVLSGADVSHTSREIESTDLRINRMETELRKELIVHVSVQGAGDIGQVLAYTLLIKKVERIGDQAKNILDLATEGVALSGAPDVAEFLDAQSAISRLFAEVATLLLEPSDDAVVEIRRHAYDVHQVHVDRIRELLHSTEPGSFAVPRAILHRYMKRVVANLASIASTLTEPVRSLDETDPTDTALDADS
jgi:phosphate uptake regulator